MKQIKILVVEDDPIVSSDIRHKLSDAGYDVCATAVSGEQAIAEATKHKPNVVLMDITLEGAMDGVQAAEEIRKKLSIPVVYLTAHSDQATVQRAKLTLPYGYVLKPIREVELTIALEMAIYAGQREAANGTAKSPLPLPASGKQLGEAERTEIKSLLVKIQPFAKVSPRILDEVVKHCCIKDYRPLEIVAMEGEDSGESGFIVISGRIAMLKTSLNGRELVVQLLGPEATFGLLSSLDSSTQELTARAQVGSKLLHIPKTCLLYLLNEMPDLYSDFLSELTRRINSLQNMARSLAHDKVDARIAAALSTLLTSDNLGMQSSQPNEIRMSRQELANLVGTTVETAIRVTRGLEDSGILALNDHRIMRVLAPEKLRELAEQY